MTCINSKGAFKIGNMALSTPQKTRFVAYYRVSTDKQGRSGLGLEAQVATIEHHVTGQAIQHREQVLKR